MGMRCMMQACVLRLRMHACMALPGPGPVQIKLVVVDSIAFHFRQEFKDMAARARVLTQLAQDLMALAEGQGVAVRAHGAHCLCAPPPPCALLDGVYEEGPMHVCMHAWAHAPRGGCHALRRAAPRRAERACSVHSGMAGGMPGACTVRCQACSAVRCACRWCWPTRSRPGSSMASSPRLCLR